MNQKISDRDKKLILLLGIVALAFLPVFLFVQPSLEKNKAAQLEIDNLEITLAQLEQWSADAETYRKGIEQAALDKEVIFNQYPSALPQEAGLLFAHRTELEIPIKLHQMSFGEEVTAQITSPAETQTIPETGEAAGGETGAEVTSTAQTLGGDLQGLSTTTRFTFTAGYQQFKNFLNHILTYQERMVIPDMNVNYSPESDTVSGNFSLIQYAITGSERTLVPVEEPVRSQGTTNIFMEAAGGFSDSGAVEVTEQADFFIMLSRPEAVTDAKMVGRSNDPAGSSYLTSDDNSRQEITITFDGKEGAYKADYSIGKSSYKGEEILFNKSGPIVLEIISSPITEEEDRVAARISIVNRTDQTVNVRVLEDDPAKSRVDIVGKTGPILMQEQ